MESDMTDKLIIFDTTLRDGEQSPGASMTKEEKIRIARQLEKLGVDVIEAGFAAASPGLAISSKVKEVECGFLQWSDGSHQGRRRIAVDFVPIKQRVGLSASGPRTGQPRGQVLERGGLCVLRRRRSVPADARRRQQGVVRVEVIARQIRSPDDHSGSGKVTFLWWLA